MVANELWQRVSSSVASVSCAEAIRRRDAGETLAAIAKSYGVDLSMISRL